MSFGELVRQHRTRNGMSQQALAEGLGISHTHLSELELGKTTSPGALIVARMVEVLHLTPFETTALLKALRKDAESKEEPSQVEVN